MISEGDLRAELERLRGVRTQLECKTLHNNPEWRDINAQVVRIEWILEQESDDGPEQCQNVRGVDSFNILKDGNIIPGTMTRVV